MSRPKYDWQEIKVEYITANLTLSGEKELSLQELAAKHNISKNVLWNKACKEGWKSELTKARKQKDEELFKKVHKLALDVDEGQLMDEYRVRSENYETATKVMDALLERWEGLTPKELSKLSTSDLIKGINVCLKARSDAAGLPSIFQQSKTTSNLVEGEIPIEASIMTQERYARLARDLEIEIAKKKSTALK